MIEQFVELRLEVTREVTYPDGVRAIGKVFDDWGLSRAVQEEVWVVAYDGVKSVRHIIRVAMGGYHESTVNIPTVISAVVAAACDRFVLAHNHPNGDVRPTDDDIALTSMVMDAANAAGLYFEDHVIVGPPAKAYSLTKHGLMIPAFPKARGVAKAAR
jgi:DNA repair protein RadC